MFIQGGIALANETVNALFSGGAALLLAPLAVWAYRSGGPKRLWLGWCVLATLALVAYASIQEWTEISFTIPAFPVMWSLFPAAVTAAAVHVMGLRRVPGPVQIIVACLAFFVILDMRMGTLIYDRMVSSIEGRSEYR